MMMRTFNVSSYKEKQTSVQVGDVWLVGEHVFACGSVAAGDAQRMFSQFGFPKHVYSDPPWGQSLYTAFKNQALPYWAQPGGETFSEFLVALIQALQPVSGHVFLEMGMNWVDELVALIESRNGFVIENYTVTYYRKHPSRLLHVSFGQKLPSLSQSVDGMDDEHTPALCLSQVVSPGDIVADVCMGKGLSSRATLEAGGISYGLELNPWRLAVGIDRMSKLTKHTPSFGGRLKSGVRGLRDNQ